MSAPWVLPDSPSAGIADRFRKEYLPGRYIIHKETIMVRITVRSSFILATILFLSSTTAYPLPLPHEVSALERAFSASVEGVSIAPIYQHDLEARAAALFSSHPDDVPRRPQYFLLVDRSPEMQTASLAFFDGDTRTIAIIGTSETSTGNPKRLGFFETPIGIFRNTPRNMNYRALGTKNKKGWRGLGAKGSRVWDLGWQPTRDRKGGTIDIRLMVHATDPDFGEPRLGRQDSKGCIRISAKFNRFLDYYGILDARYEQSARGKRVLLKDRDPVTMEGSLVVVVDSSQ